MRTETREVTVQRTVYIADDGREFYYEGDCRIYDYQLKEKTLKLYDLNFEKAVIESAVYVQLDTKEEVELFKEIYEYKGYGGADGVYEPGIYMYTPDDYWVNITPVIDHFNSIPN